MILSIIGFIELWEWGRSDNIVRQIAIFSAMSLVYLLLIRVHALRYFWVVIPVFILLPFHTISERKYFKLVLFLVAPAAVVMVWKHLLANAMPDDFFLEWWRAIQSN
jgi:hypothetical protein